MYRSTKLLYARSWDQNVGVQLTTFDQVWRQFQNGDRLRRTSTWLIFRSFQLSLWQAWRPWQLCAGRLAMFRAGSIARVIKRVTLFREKRSSSPGTPLLWYLLACTSPGPCPRLDYRLITATCMCASTVSVCERAVFCCVLCEHVLK